MKRHNDFTVDTKIVIAVLLALIGIMSFMFFNILSKGIIAPVDVENYLAEKQSTVMKLTAASTAASTVLSMLPNDWSTPLAEKLMDISTYGLIVMCAIVFEKYLVHVTGWLMFKWVVPISCFFLILNILVVKSKSMRDMILKVMLLGMALFISVPISVVTSRSIDESYQDTINELIADQETVTEEIKQESQAEGNEDWFSGLVDGITDTVTGLVDTSIGSVKKMENLLNRFIEAMAVMLVTSCLIPLLMLVVLYWVVKSLLGIDPVRYVRREKHQE